MVATGLDHPVDPQAEAIALLNNHCALPKSTFRNGNLQQSHIFDVNITIQGKYDELSSPIGSV